jgi:hypothetical protein
MCVAADIDSELIVTNLMEASWQQKEQRCQLEVGLSVDYVRVPSAHDENPSG